MKRIISLALALSVAASAMVFSSCGEKNSENTNSGTKNSKSESAVSNTSATPEPAIEDIEVSIDSSGSRITETLLSDLNKKLSNNMEIPKFTCESEKINSHEIADDINISFISKNKNDTYYSLLCHNFKKAANIAGFNVPVIAETDGTVSTLNDALADAVKNKSDIVFLAGDINKSVISGYIETAQANGIEIYSAGSKGVDEKDNYVDFTVPINYQYVGELMADWGIVKTGGKINAIAVNCTDSELSPTIAKGFKQEFEKYVSTSDGSITTINVTSLEIGNGLVNKIKAEIKKNPAINYLFVFDDSALNDAISAGVQSGSDLKIVGTGGSSADMDLAQSGSIEMLVAQSYEWTSFAMVDYALRVLGGKTLPRDQEVPFRILTKDSIKKAIEESTDKFDSFHEICFGRALYDGYNSLWST